MSLLIKRLALLNFRSHSNLEIEFENKTIIIGKNGSGKTSILESLCFLTNQQSVLHAAIKNSDFITHGSDTSSIFINTNNLSLKVNLSIHKKDLYIEGKKVKSYQDVARQIEFALIKPSDQFELMSKTRKRDVANELISIDFQEYDAIHTRYIEVMKERMQLLLNGANNLILDKIENELTLTGIELVKIREMFKATFLDKRFSCDIAESTISKNLNKEQIKAIFKNNRAVDAIIKKPKDSFHRFEFNLYFMQKTYNILSSSEQRRAVIEIIKLKIANTIAKKNIVPIILVDEIDSFLDSENLMHFISYLSEYQGQVIATSPFLEEGGKVKQFKTILL